MRDRAPPMYANIVSRALDGKGGRANAIKANCLQCAGYIRADIAACRITACPLWHYRPYQGRESDSEPKNVGVGDA